MDLISQSVKPHWKGKSGSSPVGWSAFAQVLKEANVPHDVVGESMRREWIHPSEARGEVEEEVGERGRPLRRAPRTRRSNLSSQSSKRRGERVEW